MANRYQAGLTLPYPYPVVLDAVARVLGHRGLKVTTVDPVHGMVFATRGVGLGSWGENVTVEVGQVSAQTPTQVQVTSALVFGLADWGRNRKNVQAILDALPAFLERYAGGTRLPG